MENADLNPANADELIALLQLEAINSGEGRYFPIIDVNSDGKVTWDLIEAEQILHRT